MNGCSEKTSANNRASNQPKTVNDVIQQEISNTGNETDLSTEIAVENISTPIISAPVTQANIDIDLTTMSSTMVYSEVLNIMTDPSGYIGKTIKMEGTCMCFKDETSGKTYYTCLIQDATACCAQGIEFILADNYTEVDYPNDGDNICVIGEFDTYAEGDYIYCTLKNAVYAS